jgi:hypothetical protein
MTTGNSGKNKEEIKLKLTDDAGSVLNFMASNGLVANASKTEFLFLNEKVSNEEPLTEIRVGQTMIQRSYSTKLLGVMIDENQDWRVQLKTVTTSLNHRLFLIRRIQNLLPQEKIMCVVHSLWMSKLRYGLQLYSKVVLKDDERKSSIMKALQLTQNRMLRGLNRTRVSDRISVKSMLEKYGLLSVNQLSVQIKLIEVWKSINVQESAITLEPYNSHTSELRLALRDRPNRIFKETSKYGVSQSSFHMDAARIWNSAPSAVTNAKTLVELKRITTVYARTLPI